MAKMGRPTHYTNEIADKICDLVEAGESVAAICRRDEMPEKSSVYLWLAKYPYFSDRYATATSKRAEKYAEEIVQIADDAMGLDAAGVNAARLAVDARKWVAAKLLPKKYGERQILEGGDTPIKFEPVKISRGRYEDDEK